MKIPRSSEVVNKKKTGTGFSLRSETSAAGKLNAKQYARFYGDLAMLLNGGVDLNESLAMLLNSSRSERWKTFVSAIRSSLDNGLSFSQGLEETTNTVRKADINTVRIAEHTGELSKAFDQLADKYREKIKARQSLIQALAYPTLVMFTSMGAIAFMMIVMVPVFEDSLRQTGSDLPGITKFVISVSHFLQTYGIALLLIIGILGFWITRSMRKKSSAARLYQNLERIPGIGNLIRLIDQQRLTQELGHMLQAGVPLVDSLGYLQDELLSERMTRAIDSTIDRIIEGSSLATEFEAHHVLRMEDIQMLHVAERTNNLGDWADKTGKRLRTELDNKSKTWMTLLEPLIIMILGVVVAIVLLAMYLPMFQMNTQFV